MSYSVSLTDTARKSLARLEHDMQRRIVRRLAQLVDNPRAVGVVKLSGENSYRARVGDFRILFDIDDATRAVTVFAIDHRKDAYR